MVAEATADGGLEEATADGPGRARGDEEAAWGRIDMRGGLEEEDG
jgi:hypothetical protein